MPNGEKTAPPNLSVRGYDFIEEIKTEIENTCPGVVSCADIIVMATREAVSEVHSSFLFPFKINACVSFSTKEVNCKQTITRFIQGSKRVG